MNQPAPAPTDPVSTAATTSPEPTSCETTPGGEAVRHGRERIDEIDQAIIELVRTRIEVSDKIQRVRLASGGRRVELSRETQVIGRYTRALGKPGTSVAMSLLDLCRGTC